jgi:putative ABC transport system permease protein
LWLVKGSNRISNRFLALALASVMLWLVWTLGIDIHLSTYFPHWSWLPLQFSLMLGPLIFIYVLKITRPEHKFSSKDLLHLIPLLLQLGVLFFEIRESIKTGAATYDSQVFQELNPALWLLTAVSVIIYSNQSLVLTEQFYHRQKFNGGDRRRAELKWLRRFLIHFCLLWAIWILYAAVDYLFFHSQFAIRGNNPMYLILAFMMIRFAVVAFLNPEARVPENEHLVYKPPLSGELSQKGIWLKKALESGMYYQDAELSLHSLAESLQIHAHELSRIINESLGKNFSDFINEYRIREVVRKMRDPSYDRMTLVGIAFDSGFNSKSTFNRVFRQLTGKSPAEYKGTLKKGRPFYHLTPGSGSALLTPAVFLSQKTISGWRASEKINRSYMFKNYFKIAIRQFQKQKMYAVIKVGGFALSIAACLLISLYIRNELSFDRSYPDAFRIFRLIGEFNDNGVVEKQTYWPAPLGKVLKADFPEVEISGRLMPNALMGAGNAEISRADQLENSYEDHITFADEQLLDLLKLPMVYGNRAEALSHPLSMVISKSKADKYFSGINPVGKVMYLNNDKTHPYTIGGVMQDMPSTSHLQYDFLLTLAGMEFGDGEQNNWGNFNYADYLLVRAGTDPKKLAKKIRDGVIKNYFLPQMMRDGVKNAEGQAAKLNLVLQPVTDINLYSYDIDDGFSHGDIRFIWLFGAVAGFILIIACINFVNLATAKSANRAKEVGLRKVVGSHRGSLIQQFLTESLLYSFLSFLIGLLLAWLLLPYFNKLASKSLEMPWGEWWLIPVILLSAFVVGIIAGIYPAFYLSAFKPMQVFKGALSTGSKGSLLRNGLVVFQFTASILLIIGTLVINSQMHYMLNQKVGYDKDQVVIVQGTNTIGDKNIISFKTELQKLASVKSVSISDYLPIDAGTKRNGNTFFIDGRSKLDAGVYGQFWQVDDTYLKTLGIKLLEGRNYSYDMADDLSDKTIIINQTMAKKLGLTHPLGSRITNGHTYTVIGLIADFNFDSMHDSIPPLALHFGISPSLVSVKVSGSNMKNSLESIEATWKKFAPGQPIRYSFLDEGYARMFAGVQRTGDIFTTFAVLAIVIACLGLFALSAFMAEQRSKEIGIRKVLGASVSGIATMLSVNFIKSVALAILIASPIGWWAMNKWLQGFAYRKPLEWWIFAAAGILAILIALITVSFQSIKAAIVNPVRSLRTE